MQVCTFVLFLVGDQRKDHGRVSVLTLLRGIAANVEYLASDPKLKFLEYSYFVGSAQIIIDEQGVTLENRQSIVVTPEVAE